MTRMIFYPRKKSSVSESVQIMFTITITKLSGLTSSLACCTSIRISSAHKMINIMGIVKGWEIFLRCDKCILK